jgi:hypothetical protein
MQLNVWNDLAKARGVGRKKTTRTTGTSAFLDFYSKKGNGVRHLLAAGPKAVEAKLLFAFPALPSKNTKKQKHNSYQKECKKPNSYHKKSQKNN